MHPNKKKKLEGGLQSGKANYVHTKNPEFAAARQKTILYSFAYTHGL